MNEKARTGTHRQNNNFIRQSWGICKSVRLWEILEGRVRGAPIIWLLYHHILWYHIYFPAYYYILRFRRPFNKYGETIWDRTGPRDGKYQQKLLGPATPRLMQSSPTRNISFVPWSASVATTSLALATHPSQLSSMMGGARALLSLKRSWWRRRTLREQVGPPKSARHDSSLLPLHSNIQAAAGLPQGAHVLCHQCCAPAAWRRQW